MIKIGMLNILAASLVMLTNISTITAQETDQDLIQGTWKIVSVNSPAKRNIAVAGMLVRFEDGQVQILGRTPPPGISITFRLDSKSTPRRLDIVSTSKLPDRELVITMKGIYKIKENTLLTCVGSPNGERPETFDLESDAGMTLTNHKRLKEAVRTWTDSKGKLFNEASIEFLFGDVVVLRRADSSLVRIPMDRLSKQDQEYARSWLKMNTPSGPKPPQPPVRSPR